MHTHWWQERLSISLWLYLLMVALGLAGGLAIGLILGDPNNRVRCPTEDSCVTVYEDGKWKIVEVTP